jgi:hypothetical protein
MPAEQSGTAEGGWRRSRFCVGDGHCVELSVGGAGTQVRMRNSTAPETVLVFDADEWDEFLVAIKAGELPLTR